jgi:putative NADH-flavin reductase
MNIAIFGSTGFLGKVLLKHALDEGYHVKTLVRNPDKLKSFKERVEFVQGDFFQAADVENTVRGTEAVLSTIGPPQRHPGEPESYRKAMEALVAILEHQKIQRLIHVGGAVHPGGEHEQWSLGRRFLRLLLNLTMKPVLVAKHLEWEVLRHSTLDWTLVRPPRIANGHSTGSVLADEKSLARIQVNVEDLAHFMLAQIRSDQWIRKATLVASAR